MLLRANRGWVAFINSSKSIDRQDFVNIARAVSEPLADSEISILQISTYESDYTLVNQDALALG